MRFIFTKTHAKKLARTLEKYLQARGTTLSHGQALDVLALMQGERDGNALLDSISQKAIDAELHPFELEHIASSVEDRYDEESEMRSHTGFALRYDSTGEYVRVVDPLGREIAYWHYEEWEEDPKLVMGAILGALVRGRPLLPRKGRTSKEVSRVAGSRSEHKAIASMEPLLIYTECHCTNEFGESPAWARMRIDSGLLTEILKLAQSVARFPPIGPTWFPGIGPT